jgi:hypothetical protein
MSTCPHARRSTDSRYRRLRSFKEWWQSGWGLLVQAVWLLFITAVMTIAIVSYAVDQHDASKTARTSCQRSEKFGPALAKAYAKYHVLSDVRGPHGEPSELDEYRSTIPKSCP